MKKLYTRFFIVVLVSWLHATINDVRAQTTRTIPTGSFIVNMGVTPQTIGNGLKPYGLVYDLVKNYNVPIYWAINPNKAKDGVDFNHNGVDYRGGPFIIPAEYRTATVNARITFWQSQGVVGATTVSSFSVPVAETITAAPNWTLDQKNGAIAAGYFVNAGIPSSSYNYKDPALLASCDDIFVMPHADPTWATHANLLTWNQTFRGAIWAACHAVSALEDMFNPANPDQQTNFLSVKTGVATGNGPYSENALILWGNHSGGSPPYSYSNPTDPVMQFLGILDAATQNGSEQIYLPKQSWRSTTKLSVLDPTQVDVPLKSPGPAAVVAYGPGFGDANRGKVMYEAGHSHNKGTAGDIAAQRAFFNFSFWANKDKALVVTVPALPSNLIGGQTYSVSSSVTSPVPSGPYTYQWTSTCGGTFANATASATTFTPPTVTGNTTCVVQLKVTDACGRSTTYSNPVTVTPGPRPPVTTNDVGSLNPDCASSGTSITLNVLANDSDPDGDPLTLTGVSGTNGTWTFNAATGLVTYQPTTNFAGVATATYTVCAPSPYCSTGNITVNVGSADANGCFPGSAFLINTQALPTAQTNTLVTNPGGALADDYLNADASTYAVLTSTSSILTLDFGSTFTRPTADSVVVLFASASANSTATMTVSYSVNGTTFTTVGNFSTTVNADVTEATFVVPAGGVRYVRVQRAATSAVNVLVDAAIIEDYTCQSAIPVANTDEVTANEDIPATINVLENDQSPAGFALTVRNIVTFPANGRVSVNPDNTITYVNNTDYNGSDSFTYRVCDTQGYCSTGTVNLSITADGCGPNQYRPLTTTTASITLTSTADALLRSDRATTNYGNINTTEVGRTSPRRGIFLFDLSSIPTTAVVQSANFSITRTGGDNVSLSLSAHRLTQSWVENQVTWNIRSTGINWTTAGGTFATPAAATITSAPTNDAKIFNITNLVQTWVNGSFANNGILVKQTTDIVNKRHVFATRESGTAAIRPQLAITYVNLAPCTAIPNRAPLANPDFATTPSNAPVTISVLANDSDPDAGNTVSLNAIVGAVTGGSAVISGNNIIFTPSNTFTGTAIVRYRISDGLLTDESFAFITVTNVAPVAVNDVVSYNSNTTNNTINVLANDLNPDGPNPLTTTILRLPVNGTATLSGTSILYTPTQNFFGRDTIQYQACEAVSASSCTPPLCSTAFVYITINNQPPVAGADAASTLTCLPKQINVLTNDSDPENGPLLITSATVVTANAGSVTISADKTYLVYLPQSGFTGNATITYSVCDNGSPALCATGTVTVMVNTGAATNLTPILTNDVAEDITRSQIAYVPVLSNDSDPEGTALTLNLPSPNITPAGSGTVALFGTNFVQFTPSSGFIGTATFQYQACDQSPPVGVGCPTLPSQCATATVSVRVINQAPQPVNDVASTGTNFAKNIFPLANDNEPDGDILILQAGGTTAQGGTMVLNTNGTPNIFTDDYYVYTPPLNFVGTDQFTYTVCDNVASPNTLCTTATIVINVAPPIDLELTKTFSPATPVVVGSTITFTLSLFNNSVTPATGVTVRDLLPASYQFQSSSGTGTYDAATGIWAIGTVGANTTLIRTITATVLNFNSLTNTAEVYTANEPDRDSSPNNNNPNEDDQSSVTPPYGVDLSITKTDGSLTYVPGRTTVYTLTVGNSGPSTATGALVTDNAPTGTTITTWTAVFAGGATGTASGSGNLSQAVNVPVGGTITYTVNVAVPAGFTGNLVNTATIAAPTGVPDINTTNNSATDTDTPAPIADLSITKTDGSATYTPGSPLTYTLMVTNSGPSNVTGATLADAIPAALTGVSWSSTTTGSATVTSGASGTGNSLAATLNLAAGLGNSVTFTVTGTVSPAATGNLVNTATVATPSGTTDNNPANNSATDTDTPAPVADLSITKTDNSATYTPGSPLTYTLVVTNSGPSNVTGATLADAIPAALTGVSWTSITSGSATVTSGASGSGNSLAATLNLAAGVGNSVTLTVTGTVSPAATGNLVNTATVTPPSGTTDNNLANNSATDTDTPAPIADLSITKTDNSTTYTPGNTVVYTLVVGNSGPSNATGALISDNAPTGTTITSWTAVFAGGATGTASGSGNLSQTVNVPVGGSITYTVNVAVPAGFIGNLTNTATVTPPSGTTDNNTVNNTATDTDTPAPVADLSITKTDNSATYTPGSPITYTLVVTNSGPSNVTGATLADAIPATLTGVNWSSTTAGSATVISGASGSGNSLAATLNLAAGAGNSVTFTVTGTVSPAATGNLVNTATVATPSGTTDNNAANNSATDTDTPAPVADLSITKTDNSTTYTPGSPLTYTLVVTNSGPSNVTGATLADAIPAALTGVSWTSTTSGSATVTSGASGTGNSLAATLNLAAGAGNSVTFTVTGTVSPAATGNLVNTATVATPSGTTDNNPANNSATDTDTPAPIADLSITKTDNSTTYTPGSPLTYTLVVTNSGPSNVTGATLADAIPVALTGVSWTSATTGSATVTSGASGTGNSLAATLNLAAGAGNSVTFTVTGTVSPAATGNLVNTATVATPSGTTDNNAANNSATDTDTPAPVADLSITKTDNSTTYTPGSPLTYTLVVTNSGPSNVTGATLADAIPAALTGVSWTSTTSGSATVTSGASGTGNSLAATLNLAAGAGNSVTFTVTGTVSPAATGNLVNTATVATPSGTTDNNPANNSATDTDTPAPIADLSITKTDNSTTYTPGSPLTYTLVVTNSGPSNVTGATLADAIPAALTGVSWSSTTTGSAAVTSGASGTGNSLAATLNLAAGAGNSVTFTVTGTVSPAATGNLTNTATVTPPSGTTDNNLANNSATDTDTANPLVDLSVNITDGAVTYTPGSPTIYTIVVTNTGPSNVVGASFTNSAPTGTTITNWSAVYSGGATGTTTGTGDINQLVNLPAGTSATYTVTVAIPSDYSGPLTSSATIAAPTGVTDSNLANNSASDTDTPNPVAELSITKTDNSATYTAGTSTVYTVVVSNAGPSNVIGATVTDIAPTGTGITSWTATFAGNATGTASGSNDINQLINLPSGSSVTYSIQVAIPSSYTGNLVNTATITNPDGVTDSNLANNTATDTDAPNRIGDLAITITDGSTTYTPGTSVTYTIVVGNTGPSDAVGATISNAAPTGTTITSWTAAFSGSATGVNSGNGPINETVNVPSGGGITYTVTVSVPSTYTGNLVNTATVTAPPSFTDSNPANNTDTDTDTQNSQVDLSILKTISNPTPFVGGNVTFTLVVSNNGPSTASGVTVSDLLPPGYTYVSSSGDGTYASGTGIWTIGNLTVGTSATMNITVTVNPTGDYTNSATVSGNEQDPISGNNTSTVTPNPVPVADLSITKTVNVSSPNVGSSIIFTLTVTNNGPSTATGITVLDKLPTGYTYVTDNGNGAYVSGTGVWTIGSLISGASASLSITATVLATGGYANTATVTGMEFDPNTANNSVTNSPLPSPVADISISKSVNNTTPDVGSNVVFTLTVTNSGPSTATGVSVLDMLPSGYTYVTDDGSGAYVSGTGVWTIGSLVNGASASLNITALVKASGNYQNTAIVSGSETDPTPANNTSGSTPIPVPVGDLSINITDGSATYTPGNYITYTITVGNSGPSDVTAALVNYPAPSGTTITGWTATFNNGALGAGGGSGDISELVDIPAGGTITYSVTVAVPSGRTGSLSSTATITEPTGFTDSNQTNNTSTDTDTVNAISDLVISKDDNSITYTPGTSVVYTVLISNLGPSDAPDATITDIAPAGTTITNWTAVFAGGASGTSSGTGNLNQTLNFPSGSSATYTITVSVPSGFTGNLVNTATIISANVDPVTANNSATDTDSADPQADLTISKTDNSTSFTPGVPVSYTLVVTNDGPSDVTGATVTDNAPTGTAITNWSATFTGSATGAGSGSGNINESVDVPNGASITYLVTLTVPADYPGSLSNTATIQAPAGVTDPNSANNAATDTDFSSPQTDLTISKLADTSSPNVGENVTFTLTVTNNGPSAATGVTVFDPLPAGYTYVSDNGTNAYVSETGEWTIGALANGASTSLSITATVNASGSYANTATVSGNESDPNTADNSDTNTPFPVPVADISLEKLVDNSTPLVGDDVVFTLNVTNNGPSDATGVTALDLLPSGYTYVTDSGSGAYTSGTGEWVIGNLPNGSTATLTITATVKATGDYVNVAMANADENDPEPGNNTSFVSPVPVPVADLAVTINDGSPFYTPGTSVTYTLVVSNSGPSDAPGALLVFNAPAGTTITSWNATLAGGATGTTAGSGNINELVNLPLNGSITYLVTVAVPAAFTGPLTSSTSITPPGGVTDPQLNNNTSTDTDTQNSSTDLAITKAVALDLPQVGSSATFTLTVTNNGPSNATGVTVDDLLPAGYTYLTDNSGGAYNSTTGLWAIGNLPAGSSVVLTVSTSVNPAGPYLNSASVSGNQNDPNTVNNQDQAGLQQLQLLPKVYLQGALFGVTYSNPPTNSVVDPLMRDELRVKNLIPLTSPYAYWNPTLPANTIAPAVLTVTGPDAIVDWVFVELRSAADPTLIVSSRSALLQRDGDIVELDGISPLQVRSVSNEAYYVAVRHRNHLAVMTQNPISLTPTGVIVDFRQPTTPTYVKGPAAIHQAQVVVLQGRAMWAGNALRDGAVIYQGTANDVNVIAQQVLSAPANTSQLPFYILKGYYSGDINLNGEVIFQSTRNDVEFIYQNVIKNHPGNTLKDNFFVIQEQLPD